MVGINVACFVEDYAISKEVTNVIRIKIEMSDADARWLCGSKRFPA